MHFTNAFIRGKKPPFRGVFKYKDEGGEWRQTVRTLKAQGISEAKRELAELRVQLEEEHEREVEVARATMTVDEYLEGYIADLDATRSLERSTINGYRSYAKYVSNGLGSVRLSQLNAAQVQAWEAKLLKDGLSAVSVRKAHVLLKSACEHAVQTDLIPKNPLCAVKPPKAEAPMPNALDDRRRRAAPYETCPYPRRWPRSSGCARARRRPSSSWRASCPQMSAWPRCTCSGAWTART